MRTTLALALLAAGIGSVASGDSARMAVTGAPVLVAPVPLKDPFPIRRITLNEAQLEAALKEHDVGPVLRMPRAEFEARVQKAARNALDERETPRLIEANYSAILDGGDLVGEAEWTFLNRRGTPADFPLVPLRLAIHSATWADGSVAILGAFGDDAGLDLRIPPGKQTLKLKWSAAGSGTDADRQFDLRLPPCSTAALALDLPPDRTPSNSPDVLLTGPFPATRDVKLKQWRFRFGERTRLELGIRGPSDAGGTLVASTSVSKYDLTDSQLGCTFEFELKTARGSLAEWAFQVPPGLAVTDAIANDRAAWRFDAATRTLRIALRQAANSGKFVISATGPLLPALTPLPLIKPLNVVGSSERIELRIPPNVALERLEAGDFRIAETSTTDGTRTTTLVGSVASGPSRKPPSIRVASTSAEFTTNETLEWRIDANRVLLAARVEVSVRRGPLFRIAFRSPPGFALDRVTNEPDDAVSYSALGEVEFSKPLAGGQRVVLNFEFRGPTLPSGEATFLFPTFAPVGAAERDGRIQFAPGSGWSLAAHPVGEANGDLAKGFRYRGAEPAGSLTLTPIASAFTASFEKNFVRLTPTRGQLEAVRFLESGPPTKRIWKLLGSSNAISSATAASVGSLPLFSGTIWTIQLLRPASEAVVLETSAGSLEVLGASEVRYQTDPSADPSSKPRPREWSFENLHLITVASPTRPMSILGGTILARADSTLTLQLPDGATVQSASIGGNAIEPGLLSRGSGELRLPLPDVSGPLRFEVRYRLTAAASPPFRIASPLPELPGDASPIARWWAVPNGVSAIAPLGLHSQSAASSVPATIIPLESGLTFYRTDASLTLVPSNWLDLLGIAAAVLLAIVGWIGCRLVRRTIGVILLILSLVIGAAFWLGPDAWQRAALPPLIAALLGSAAIAAVRGWKPARARTVAALLVLVPTFAATAQAPAARDVAFFVNDVAVVPQALLKRLEVQSTEPAIVIGAASYTGGIEDGLARFTAKYTVHSFRDGESLLDLPLADVRLERATVDGKPAQPLAAKADVYSLPIAGRGPHTVELRFAATINMTGPEREVRFGIPTAPDSRVEFTAPLNARQLQVVSRTGSERTSRDKDANRVDAMLGGIRGVHLRWREGTGGAAATLDVREGCIWDVSEATHRLTACYHIQVKSGDVPSFRFDLPVNLEPTRIAVRSLDSLLVPIVIRDWSLGKEANGTRPLTIDLIAPVDGRVLVTLECEPRTAPVHQPVLTFPRPVGMTRESAVYGLRTTGVIAESIGRTGVIDFASDALARDFGAVPDLRLNPAIPVVAFSPRAGELAELRPVLKLMGTQPTVTQDVTWNIEPPRALGRGTIAWSSGDATSLIEFPFAAAISEVRGTDLAAWSQFESRVQVWFKKPLKDGSLEWTATATPAAPFEPPIPVLLNARSAGQTVRMRTAAGWGVRIDREKGWRPVASEEREWAYQCEGSLPPPRVYVFPPNGANARGFAMLEFNGSSIAFRAAVEIPTPVEQSQHLVLQVHGMPAGATATLDVPPGTIVRERKEGEGSQSWSLDVPASSAALFRATVSLPLPTKGTVFLPTIDLRNGNRAANPTGVVRALGMTGNPPTISGATQATGAESTALQAAWPGEAERLRRAGGTMWLATGGRVAASLNVPEAPAPPVAVAPPASTAPVDSPPTSSVAWITALAWCGAAIGVLLLFVRAPRATWPEQLGLLGAMLGFALTGQFAWGIAAYAVARNVWLFRVILSVRK